MDVLDPWTVTVAVITVCVGIIVLQWFTFQKKLKATHLLMEQQNTAPSPKVEPHSVNDPVVPSPVTHVGHGPVVTSPVAHVGHGPVVPSPVAHVAEGPVVSSPVTHVAHGPVVPSPVAHGSPAMVPTSKKGREVPEEPPPVKLPPLPEFFDQTFTEYGEKYGTSVVERHRKTHPGCRFVRRIIKNCLPKDMVSPKSIAPFTDRFLFAYESTRIYYLHLPKGVLLNASEDFTEYGAPTSIKGDSDKGRKYPVVIFIHDKDETCFDGEFIEHPNKTPSQTWLDLSDEEGIILVFAQARGQWANHKSSRREARDPLKTLWLLQCQDANQLDQVYLENILDDLREICSHVDMKKIYVTGYVDGGNLATDVAIGCTVKSVVDSPYIPWLKYPLAAVCLYMGGITNYQMKKTLNIDKYKLGSAIEIMSKCTKGITKKENEENEKNKSHKPDVLIVTGEPEIFACIHAVQCFYQLGYGVKVIKMDDRVQAYYPENTMEIWKFFQQSPHL